MHGRCEGLAQNDIHFGQFRRGGLVVQDHVHDSLLNHRLQWDFSILAIGQVPVLRRCSLGVTYLEQFEVHGRLGGFLAEATEGTVNAILLLSVYGIYIECECNSPLMFHCLIPEL
jgi:hypothetical protein